MEEEIIPVIPSNPVAEKLKNKNEIKLNRKRKAEPCAAETFVKRVKLLKEDNDILRKQMSVDTRNYGNLLRKIDKIKQALSQEIEGRQVREEIIDKIQGENDSFMNKLEDNLFDISMLQNTETTTSGTWAKDEKLYGTTTKLVHGGQKPCVLTGAVLAPIYLSTTFAQESIAKYQRRGYSYSRSANPTVHAYERKMAIIENGFGATVFGTGMAATNTVMNAYLKSGDHVVITDCSYGGTNRCARVLFAKFGIEFSFVDFRDPKIVEAAMRPNTRMIFSETPCNPTVSLCDVRAISDIAKKQENCVHVCDTTFATPMICKPLDHGADICIQSLTKYYDGHNISVGGAAICKTQEDHEKCQFMRNVNGNIMKPQTAFQQMQTMKTMRLRIVQQCKTAMAVATFLEAHEMVDKCHYPGLKSFPQKELADRQHLDGLHGGMLWFEVKGGVANGQKLMDTVRRPWTLAENLGATESIITCPAVMTHANMLKEDRMKVGITDGFVRVSCGIEDTDDLVGALKEALDNMMA